MDYIEGQSLARLVGNRPLPARQAAQYVRTIAEAVHYAHERGLLHRDLKPANVLVDTENQVRVMDFGLARRLEGDSELTLTGQVLGSPHYMPPEQAAGKRGRVSRRTDVYGLGAILYHLLTGRPPFVGEELADMLQHVLDTDPVAPRLLNPAVPRDLETICLKCLEKEPARRYATAAVVADELSRYLEDKPIAARPVGRLEKIWRWCHRQPVRAGLTAALLTVLLLGAFGVLWQWRRAEEERRNAEANASLARQNAYAADMNLAFQAVEADDRGRALNLLNQYWPAASAFSTLNPQPSTDLRGWEWRHLWKRCESEAVRPLTNYDYMIGGLAVSTNGRWLAVSTASNTMIWDLVARQHSGQVPISAAIAAVDVSADGRLVACAEADFTGTAETIAKDFGAVVFDTTTRTIVARFPHPETTTWLAQVALSPDARVLASLDWEKEKGEDKGFVRLWSLETRQCLRSIPVPPGSSMYTGKLRFSPDGQLLAIGQQNGYVRIMDWATTNVLHDISPPGTNNPVTALAYSPDGRQLAVGYGRIRYGLLRTNIYLWNAQTGEPAGQLAGHRKQIGSLCFLPGGQRLASAGDDGTIRLWDVAARTEIRRLSGHAGPVYALVTLPDGETLVSGGFDHCVCLWNTEYRKPGYTTESLSVDARDFAFTPDSRHVLAVNGEDRIEAWETATLQRVAGMGPLGTSNLCLAVVARAERSLLAAGTEGGWVNVWDITSLAAPQLVTSFKAHTNKVAALKFDPHGQTLISSPLRPGAWANTDPGNLKAWDTSSWRERPEFRVGSHQVAYLPEANLMAVRRAPAGHCFAVRDLRTGKEQTPATMHKHALATLVFSPDGRWLASGCHDGTVKLWEVGTWRCVATLPGTGSAAVDIAFSPDGQRMVTGSDPVKLWDLATRRELASLALDGTLGDGTVVAFSPDGNTLAVRDRSGMHFWRAPPLAEISDAHAH
jgi:WD40 repeat protein